MKTERAKNGQSWGHVCGIKHSSELIFMFEKVWALVYFLVQNFKKKHSFGWDSNPLLIDSVDYMEGVSRTNFGPKVKKIRKGRLCYSGIKFKNIYSLYRGSSPQFVVSDPFCPTEWPI